MKKCICRKNCIKYTL